MKGGYCYQGNTEKFSPHLKLHIPLGHLEVLMPEHQKAKKGITTLAGAINFDYHEDIGWLLPNGSWENMAKSQGIHWDDL